MRDRKTERELGRRWGGHKSEIRMDTRENQRKQLETLVRDH